MAKENGRSGGQNFFGGMNVITPTPKKEDHEMDKCNHSRSSDMAFV